MIKSSPSTVLPRAKWKVGARVRRLEGDEHGSVVEIGAGIKVKWDSGATSHFQHGKRANIKLKV